jgi:Plasmid encoded RepA protein
VLELSQPFFETLVAHAVPLDPRAIHALKKSALALDVYSWLGHRLCRVRKQDGVKLSWSNLRKQFGQEYACSKDFKKKFRGALCKVRMVYPSARIDDEIGGIRLYSSPPPIPKSSIVVKLPG